MIFKVETWLLKSGDRVAEILESTPLYPPSSPEDAKEMEKQPRFIGKGSLILQAMTPKGAVQQQIPLNFKIRAETIDQAFAMYESELQVGKNEWEANQRRAQIANAGKILPPNGGFKL